MSRQEIIKQNSFAVYTQQKFINCPFVFCKNFFFNEVCCDMKCYIWYVDETTNVFVYLMCFDCLINLCDMFFFSCLFLLSFAVIQVTHRSSFFFKSYVNLKGFNRLDIVMQGACSDSNKSASRLTVYLITYSKRPLSIGW